jgi:hypothetical protein
MSDLGSVPHPEPDPDLDRLELALARVAGRRVVPAAAPRPAPGRRWLVAGAWLDLLPPLVVAALGAVGGSALITLLGVYFAAGKLLAIRDRTAAFAGLADGEELFERQRREVERELVDQSGSAWFETAAAIATAVAGAVFAAPGWLLFTALFGALALLRWLVIVPPLSRLHRDVVGAPGPSRRTGAVVVLVLLLAPVWWLGRRLRRRGGRS